MIDEALTTKLAAKRGSCHQRAMTAPRSQAKASGCLIALGVLAGAGTGIAIGEPSLGTLAGAAAGIVLALLFWLVERFR